ncbi:hypothetical protein FHG87_006837 [Trinorchestia longiramus]|nr:hypothetical protein FHG87_006837 [Trinorchestia longiramus]
MLVTGVVAAGERRGPRLVSLQPRTSQPRCCSQILLVGASVAPSSLHHKLQNRLLRSTEVTRDSSRIRSDWPLQLA